MQGFSSIEVRINALAPACVLDAELALSPAGLLLATRMAREWPIWLVRSMWPMIDSDQLYRRCPRIISGPGEPQEDVDALIKALGDWHAAWLGNRVKGCFHWLGDLRRESAIPEDADENLLVRFEALVGGRLRGDRRDEDDAVEGWLWRRTCAGEALALAAALQTRPTIVLAAAAKGARPTTVALWEEFTRTECPPRDVAGAPPVALPASLRVGLLPLLDHGARLAAIHVVAPRALALPWGTGGEVLWGAADPGFPDPEEPAPDPWDGARLAWHFIP